MEFSVTAGLGHIERFMHPQVILIDDSAMEESYFTKGMRSSALASSKCIIELPTNAAEDLLWVTRLDTGSLSGKLKLTVVFECHVLNALSMAYYVHRYCHTRTARFFRVSYKITQID